jgi:hypothetical protein
MLKRLPLVGSLLVLSLAAPASAAAAPNLPPDVPIRARLVDGTIVSMRFAPSLFRQLAGRRVLLECTQMPAASGPGWDEESAGSESFRMPNRRRVVRRFVGSGYDYCSLHVRGRRLVTFALSERGAVALDEQGRAITLFVLLTLATDRNGRFTPPEEFIPSRRGQAAARWPIVAMATPSETPPDGTIGYYSDGAEHAAVVVLSEAGRRLFVELNADDVLHTNVAKYLYGGLFSGVSGGRD